MKEQVLIILLTSIPRHIALASEILDMEMLPLVNAMYDNQLTDTPGVTDVDEMVQLCKDAFRRKIKNNV